MFRTETDPATGLLVIRAEGKLTDTDYARFHAALDARLAARNEVAFAVDLRGFEGWESGEALLDDVKMDLRHGGHIRRLAIVGDARWQKWMAWIAKPFTSGAVQYFDAARMDEAIAWAAEAREYAA